MQNHPDITATVQLLKSAAEEVDVYCMQLSPGQFFMQPEGKWSAAQQVKHLVTATDTARLAFILPRLIVRLVGGKPNRPSRTFDELEARYRHKLSEGGKAGRRYIPHPVPSSYGQEKLLAEFTSAMHRVAIALQKRWRDDQLDAYIVPHPLLGKITLRELAYFTIFHARHHLHTIKMLMDYQPRT